MLSLVPFDIATMDSSLARSGSSEVTALLDSGKRGEKEKEEKGVREKGASAVDGGSEGKQPLTDLVGTILNLGMKHLGDTGPTRCGITYYYFFKFLFVFRKKSCKMNELLNVIPSG